ncbi:hypothetical protein SAMN04489717_4269 [Actinopolymorpha singaporensis]|uniref:Uncharacterized protein n=1 Tax=Actinopolymorpha singaporensis TaxID=117157 RepID=A0A1H1VYU6_9ACTN|nr:hypothetical protein SAMN04489717_4269 [Actinopolymorpha singaporensis]
MFVIAGAARGEGLLGAVALHLSPRDSEVAEDDRGGGLP